MELGAVIALSSSCLTVARFAASAAMGMHDLRQRYLSVGRDIGGLAAQISTIESALSELSTVLSRPSSSLTRNPRVPSSIQSCIAACSAVIVDIQDHIGQVRSDDGITFGGRIAHLWSGDIVQQYERRLSMQIQALQLLLTVSQIGSPAALDRRLRDRDAESILSSAESDARTYLKTRSNKSGSSFTSDSVTITAEYAFDSEAIDSEAYRRAFVSLLKSEPSASSSAKQPNRRGSSLFIRLFRGNSSKETVPTLNLPSLPPGKTPTIEEINTAILMGATPKQVQNLLLQGDPPANVSDKDKLGLAPIHMACLIPEGLYPHTPLSVFEVLVAAGASTDAPAAMGPGAAGGSIPDLPYFMAAYARNTSLIKYMNGMISRRDSLPSSCGIKRLDGNIATFALELACINVNTSGPFLGFILKTDAYPHLRAIYAERTSIAATARRKTIKAILELEKKCRFATVGDGKLGLVYWNRLAASLNALSGAFSNSVEEKSSDMRLIRDVMDAAKPPDNPTLRY